MLRTNICILLVVCTCPQVVALRLAHQSLDNFDDEVLPDYDDSVLIQQFPELDAYDSSHLPNDDQIPDRLKGGIAFIKAHKVGGSTWAGVMRRIGQRYGLQHARDAYWLKTAMHKHKQPGPSVWANHGTMSALKHELTHLMPNAFYVTLIRNPIDTAMSRFYFSDVSRNGVDPTVEKKMKFLRNAKSDELNKWISSDPWKLSPEETLASYMLVGVAERFDESLLLLGRKLGCNKTDLLYLKAKVAGMEDDKLHSYTKLVAHPPFSTEPPEVQEAAEHFQNGKDMQLYKLANEALDNAIGEYGVGFHTDLKEFQDMLLQVENACRSHFWEGCLWNDNGCAQDCIDQYAQKHGWH